ncbi:mechanosensitive ion channel family protein [bacterium]|nr:mechanosensitive ion channel family protein [bacterium]
MYIEQLLYEYFQVTYTGWGGLAWTIGLRLVEALLAIAVAFLVMIIIQRLFKSFVSNIIPKFLSVGSEEERIERTMNVVTSVVRFLTIFFWTVWMWFIILIVMQEIGVLGGAVSKALWMSVLYKLCLIFVILIGVELALTFINFAVDKWVESVEDDDPAFSDAEKRAHTISYLLKSTLRYMLYFVGFMMILKEIGLDIGPALAGAGVMGLAIGFGAQTLVKDILSGFFILFEGQFHVGDYIKVGSISGTVEKMTLRLTVVRSFDGALHMFPNSSLDTVSVLSRGFSRAIVEVGVTYNEDIDILRTTINEIVGKFEHPDLLDRPVVMGVTKLGDFDVTFRVAVRTRPLAHWSIERELRQMIKRGLDERGIEIPFPQQVVHYIPDDVKKDALPVSAKQVKKGDSTEITPDDTIDNGDSDNN